MHQNHPQGRVVVITGAGGGIGRAIAVAFAEKGDRLVLSDLHRPDGLLHDHHWVDGDIREHHVVAELVRSAEERGGIDVLVHAAGVQVRKPALEIEEHEWERLLSVNLTAAFTLTRASAPQLERSRGAVVSIGSLSASHVLPGIIPYGATKAALTQLTKGLAVELGPRGVRVNAVAPGHMITPMTEKNLARPEVRERLLPRIPLERFGAAEDVAHAVLWLSSAQASYITGTVLAVDGGYSAT